MPNPKATRIGRMGVLRLAFVLLAVGAALPAVLAFTTESGSQPCLAIRDGWQADRRPTDADLAVLDSVPPLPAEGERVPPEALAEMRRILATPEYRRASERLDWLVGPGACVLEARHRLILSGAGLAAVAVAGALAAVVVRRRR